VAVYFLILGLLNSRRRPQLLSGRLDFALLIGALSPLLVLPVVGYLGGSALAVAATVAALAAVVLVLAPGRTWVIYNIPRDEVRRIVQQSLQSLGEEPRPTSGGLCFGPENASIRLSEFALLRNVTIRMTGGERIARPFARALASRLAGVTAETSPMAVSLLLVASAMIVAPVAMMAHRVPEIVRLLTDLLH